MASAENDGLLHAKETPWKFGNGVTYSCPWDFQLPSVLGYSLFVASNPFKRHGAPTEFSEHQVKNGCEFPTFEPNTVWLTWLGHASCLFTFYGDSPAGDNGTVRVLCDPNFSNFIGPTRFSGSSRHIPSACQVGDLPEIHALCISHNHMDHMDEKTLKELAKKMPNIQCFVPAGDRMIMQKFGFKDIQELKWWQAAEETVKGLSVTFTPASHWSGRGAMDRNCSLWGSFVLQFGQHSAFFAGDTGYQDRIFKDIGQNFGPFSLSAIPIGCYEPREVFSVQHACPSEAVIIHQEVRSKLSVGIHWGAFRMTTREGLLQPPEDLREAMEEARQRRQNVAEFRTIKVGEKICWPLPPAAAHL